MSKRIKKMYIIISFIIILAGIIPKIIDCINLKKSLDAYNDYINLLSSENYEFEVVLTYKDAIQKEETIYKELSGIFNESKKELETEDIIDIDNEEKDDDLDSIFSEAINNMYEDKDEEDETIDFNLEDYTPYKKEITKYVDETIKLKIKKNNNNYIIGFNIINDDNEYDFNDAFLFYENKLYLNKNNTKDYLSVGLKDLSDIKQEFILLPNCYFDFDTKILINMFENIYSINKKHLETSNDYIKKFLNEIKLDNIIKLKMADINNIDADNTFDNIQRLLDFDNIKIYISPKLYDTLKNNIKDLLFIVNHTNKKPYQYNMNLSYNKIDISLNININPLKENILPNLDNNIILINTLIQNNSHKYVIKPLKE